MPPHSPKPVSQNSTATLLQKAIADASPGKPGYQQVKLTDREKAMCAVFDHQMRLHCFDRDGYAKRLDALALQLARLETRLSHGFTPNKDSVR